MCFSASNLKTDGKYFNVGLGFCFSLKGRCLLGKEGLLFFFEWRISFPLNYYNFEIRGFRQRYEDRNNSFLLVCIIRQIKTITMELIINRIRNSVTAFLAETRKERGEVLLVQVLGQLILVLLQDFEEY